MRKYGALFIFSIIFGSLVFCKLGVTSLWHDEAEVGLIAKSIMSTGAPSVTGAEGFFPIGHDEGYHFPNPPYLIRQQTWLMYYIGAVGVWLFGATLFGLRFPFVLIGLCILPLFYIFVKLVTDNKKAAILATVLLGFSVQYILLIRNARYYAPVMFFSLLSAYAFIRGFIDEARHAASLPQQNSRLIFFISLFALFHVHYLSFYALVPGFIFAYIYASRYPHGSPSEMRLRHMWFCMGMVVSFVFSTMWMVLGIGAGKIPVEIQMENIHMIGLPNAFIELLKKLNRTMPLPLLLAGLAMLHRMLSKTAAQRGKSFLIVSLWLSVMLVVSIGTFFQLPPSIFPDFRYILAVYPLAALLVGLSLFYIPDRYSPARWLCVFLLLTTNIFSYPVEYLSQETYWPVSAQRLSIRSYLVEYIHYELNRGYVGPIDAIFSFIKPRIGSGDRIFASSEGIALMYGLPGVMIDNEYTLARRAGRSMRPEDLLGYRWVIFRNICPVECIFKNGDVDAAFNILKQDYIPHILGIEDYIVQNREEIPYHLFATSHQDPKVVIYEKRISL